MSRPACQYLRVTSVLAVAAIGLCACASGKAPEVQRTTEGPTADEEHAARFAGEYGRAPSFDETAAFRADLENRVAAYLARHPDLATSTRASQFTFHRRAAVGMTREEVTLLMGPPASTSRDVAQMQAAARQFWPSVARQAREMWTYPGGWSLYFDGDRLVDLTVIGEPPR